MRIDLRLFDLILELDLISKGVIMKRYFSVTCYCYSLIINKYKIINRQITLSSLSTLPHITTIIAQILTFLNLVLFISLTRMIFLSMASLHTLLTLENTFFFLVTKISLLLVYLDVEVLAMEVSDLKISNF